MHSMVLPFEATSYMHTHVPDEAIPTPIFAAITDKAFEAVGVDEIELSLELLIERVFVVLLIVLVALVARGGQNCQT